MDQILNAKDFNEIYERKEFQKDRSNVPNVIEKFDADDVAEELE